jgi:signal peptidase I
VRRQTKGKAGRKALVIIAVGAMGSVAALFLDSYRIPSRSMEDTVLYGDYLLIEKISYGAEIPFTNLRFPFVRAPRPGDVVIFRAPDSQRLYAKRCVAVGGQRVEVKRKVLYVDGVRPRDPPFSKYQDPRVYEPSQTPRDNMGPIDVPDGHLFLVGDNRDNSRDSRHWGSLPNELAVGRALLVYWSSEPEVPNFGDENARVFLFESVRSLPSRIRWSRLGRAVI